jgi:hypothetical protein
VAINYKEVEKQIDEANVSDGIVRIWTNPRAINLTDEELDTQIPLHYRSYRLNRKGLGEYLVEKHRRLSCRGCKGEFSAYLARVEIPRSSAYEIMGWYNDVGQLNTVLMDAAEIEIGWAKMRNPPIMKSLHEISSQLNGRVPTADELTTLLKPFSTHEEVGKHDTSSPARGDAEALPDSDAEAVQVSDEAEEAVRDHELIAALVRGEVAGVGDCRGAVLIDTEDQAGGEAVLAASQHAEIHGGEDFGGALCVVGERADGANQQRHGHGGGHALPADVADDDQSAVVWCGDDLEEVAADLAGGLVDALEGEAGDGRDFFGDEDLLDCAGGFEFRFEALFVASRASKAQHQDGENGNLAQKVGEVRDGDGKRPFGEVIPVSGQRGKQGTAEPEAPNPKEEPAA